MSLECIIVGYTNDEDDDDDSEEDAGRRRTTSTERTLFTFDRANRFGAASCFSVPRVNA